MIDLLTLEKDFIRPHVKEGGVVVDFTMGNGHDTLWLSQQVGENGKVFAFDIQQAAVDSTAAFLEKEGAPKNYTLICASHHRVKEFVNEPICAGMFNLGWLPGADKAITTLRETTLPAIEAAIDLLDHDGGILIAVYPGHAEGKAEGELIYDMLSKISRYKLCCSRFQIVNSPTSPYFYLIEKK